MSLGAGLSPMGTGSLFGAELDDMQLDVVTGCPPIVDSFVSHLSSTSCLEDANLYTHDEKDSSFQANITSLKEKLTIGGSSINMSEFDNKVVAACFLEFFRVAKSPMFPANVCREVMDAKVKPSDEVVKAWLDQISETRLDTIQAVLRHVKEWCKGDAARKKAASHAWAHAWLRLDGKPCKGTHSFVKLLLAKLNHFFGLESSHSDDRQSATSFGGSPRTTVTWNGTASDMASDTNSSIQEFLKNGIDTLQHLAKSNEVIIKRLEALEKSSEDQNGSKNSALKMLESKLDDEVKSLQGDLNSGMSERADLFKQCAQLKADLDESKSLKSGMVDSSMDDVDEQLKQLQADVDDLRRKQVSRSEFEQFKRGSPAPSPVGKATGVSKSAADAGALTEQMHAIRELTDRVDALEDETGSMRQRADGIDEKLEYECHQWKTHTEQATSSMNSTMTMDSSQAIRDLEGKISSLRSELEGAVDDIIVLRGDTENVGRKMTRLQQRADEDSSSLAELQDKVDSIEVAPKAAAPSQDTRWRKTFESRLESIESGAMESIKRLRAELTGSGSSASRMDDALRQISRIESKSEGQDRQVKQLKDLHETLSIDIGELKSQVGTLTRSKNTANGDLASQIEAAKSETESQISQIEGSVDSLEAGMARLREEVNGLSHRVADSSRLSRENSASSANDEVVDRVDSLAKEMHALQSRTVDSESIRRRIEPVQQRLEESLREVKTKLDSSTSNITRRVEQMERQNSRLESRLRMFEQSPASVNNSGSGTNGDSNSSSLTKRSTADSEFQAEVVKQLDKLRKAAAEDVQSVQREVDALKMQNEEIDMSAKNAEMSSRDLKARLQSFEDTVQEQLQGVASEQESIARSVEADLQRTILIRVEERLSELRNTFMSSEDSRSTTMRWMTERLEELRADVPQTKGLVVKTLRRLDDMENWRASMRQLGDALTRGPTIPPSRPVSAWGSPDRGHSHSVIGGHADMRILSPEPMQRPHSSLDGGPGLHMHSRLGMRSGHSADYSQVDKELDEMRKLLGM